MTERPDGRLEGKAAPFPAGSRYRQLRHVAGGGQGDVYLAYDRQTRRKVALKVLRSDGCSFREGLVRFEREVRALRSLVHTNVVRIHDYHRRGRVRFYTMEFVEGRSLDTLLEEERISLREAVLLGAQVAAGLAAAHAQGLLHRDVKPANVLVTHDGRVKINDFGTVKFLDPGATTGLTGAYTVVGTIPYLPPEILAAQPPRPASDVYQLGLLLYELVTGKNPMLAYPLDQVASGEAARALPPLAQVDRRIDSSLSDLVARAMAADPGARPTARDFHQALLAWLRRPRSSAVRRRSDLSRALRVALGARAGDARRQDRPSSSRTPRRAARPSFTCFAAHGDGAPSVVAALWSRLGDALRIGLARWPRIAGALGCLVGVAGAVRRFSA